MSAPTRSRDDLHRLALAREAFLAAGARGDAPVRDVVAASWRRSRSAGVDAEEYRITYHADVDLDSRLVRCARPVIERLAGEMDDVPVAIALSDAQARIVARLDCSSAVGRRLDQVDFNRGFSFAEGGVGTNGIGTVFESGTSVSVVGAEHFTQALVAFACTGAPIVDPVTGRTEGVLDVSSLAESWTPLMHTLVRRAAADIGRNLLLDRSQAKQALFEAFVRADSRPRQAVMAVGDSLMVNRRAQLLFSPTEQFALHQHALYVMERRDTVRDTLDLDSGRSVRLRASRVLVGEEVAGVVLLLDDPAARVPAPTAPPFRVERRRRPSRPAVGGRSVGWVKAATELSTAFDDGGGVLVLGEPGSGRATLLGDLFRAGRPAAHVLTVGTQDADLPSPREVAALAAGAPVLVVLRRLDLAAEERAEELDAALTGWDRAGAEVAATVDPAALGADDGVTRPFERLLRRFAHAVTVPALRFRTEDLPSVVSRMLEELAPDRTVRLDATATRLVERHTWPGNLVELRTALAEALSHRPVGALRAGDLPASCHGVGTRLLTPIETVERDAMVRALADHGGNRVHAAAALGMSRSSLYRKIRTYGITEV